MKWYSEILAFIQSAARDLRAARAVNLAPQSAAILSRRRLSLAVLARPIAGSRLTNSRSHRHCKKRLFRFLSNDRFDLDSTTVASSNRLQRLVVGALLACAILILSGMRPSPSFRRQVYSWGRIGVLHLGLEYYLSAPEPPLRYLGLPDRQSGHA